MLNIDDRNKNGSIAFLHLGFRPFFLVAGLSAILAITLWAAVRSFGLDLGPLPVAATQWHGHEMVFGYSLAVVAGFLLTAVYNWTGIRTASGAVLFSMALLWLLARIGWVMPAWIPMSITAGADLLFMTFLSIALLRPVFKVRQWKQLGIIAKVVLLMVANGLFYAGVFGLLEDGVRMGLYLGLYLVIALIMTMGRRVIPFFIEKGVGCPFQPKNWRWLDIASLLLFLLFTVVEVFYALPRVSALLAAALFLLHGLRLWGWYTPAIWTKPLLWVLFLGYGWLVIGFALWVLVWLLALSPFIALHAFAVGGVGLITLGMMARVALGHTGRNVFDPPAGLTPIFGLLLMAALLRVFGPLWLPLHYEVWLWLSQGFWVAGFAAFLWLYAPMLLRPRTDGRWG